MTTRYTVHYDVGGQQGAMNVYAADDDHPDYVIARAQRLLWGGHAPLGLYSQSWTITDIHGVDGNPKGKRKAPRHCSRLGEADVDVLQSLEAAIFVFPHLPHDDRTLMHIESDGEPYRAAVRMIKCGYAVKTDAGTYRGNKWVISRLSDAGGAELDRSLARNPAELGRPGDDEVVVLLQGPQGAQVPKVVGGVEFVEGVLAIHPSMRNLREIEEGTREQPNSWGVSHVPTGQLVATVGSKAWARRLAREIVAFSDAGLESMELDVAAQAIGGTGYGRTRYLLHVQRQSQEAPKDRGRFPTYATWKKHSAELDNNPMDLRSQAAVAAAVGTLVGGVLGAVGGAIILGAVGGAVGGAVVGGAGIGGGVVLGAVWGVPLGAYVGSIWGAVRQTDQALQGYDGDTARILAGLGAAVTGPLAPVGAGVGAYLGAPG